MCNFLGSRPTEPAKPGIGRSEPGRSTCRPRKPELRWPCDRPCWSPCDSVVRGNQRNQFLSLIHATESPLFLFLNISVSLSSLSKIGCTCGVSTDPKFQPNSRMYVLGRELVRVLLDFGKIKSMKKNVNLNYVRAWSFNATESDACTPEQLFYSWFERRRLQWLDWSS